MKIDSSLSSVVRGVEMIQHAPEIDDSRCVCGSRIRQDARAVATQPAGEGGVPRTVERSG